MYLRETVGLVGGENCRSLGSINGLNEVVEDELVFCCGLSLFGAYKRRREYLPLNNNESKIVIIYNQMCTTVSCQQ